MTRERGSMTTVAVSLAMLTLVLGTGVASVAIVLTGRTRATTAADAAALAAAPATFPPLGLPAPEVLARRLAAENGGQLVACSCSTDATWAARTVQVEVAVEVSIPVIGATRLRAASRAEFEPVALFGAARAGRARGVSIFSGPGGL